LSDFPADIIAAAKRSERELMRAPFPDGGWQAVARALMAERERCLNVSRAEAEKRLENVGGYPAARVHDFLVVARSIERKIESGANAAANSPAPEVSAAATRTATTEGKSNV